MGDLHRDGKLGALGQRAAQGVAARRDVACGQTRVGPR